MSETPAGEHSADYGLHLSAGRCLYCGEVEPRLPCPMCRPAPDDGDDPTLIASEGGESDD